MSITCFSFVFNTALRWVVYEAARAICNLVPAKTFVSKDIAEAAVLALRCMTKEAPARNKTSQCAVHVVASRNLLLTLQQKE